MGHLAGPASRAGEVSAKSMPLAISTSFRAAASGLGKRRSAVSFMRKMPIMVGSDPPRGSRRACRKVPWDDIRPAGSR